MCLFAFNCSIDIKVNISAAPKWISPPFPPPFYHMGDDVSARKQTAEANRTETASWSD